MDRTKNSSTSQPKITFDIGSGFPASQKEKVAELFWSAFKNKLGAVMSPEAKAKRFILRVMDPAHALSATTPDGVLIGAAGFKTRDGAFVGGTLRDLSMVYGVLGGVWRGMVLSLLERPVQQGTLLMDGIFVSDEARGCGVGSALLDAIKDKAKELGCERVHCMRNMASEQRLSALWDRFESCLGFGRRQQ